MDYSNYDTTEQLPEGQHIRYIGRPASAATGSLKVHFAEQEKIIEAAMS